MKRSWKHLFNSVYKLGLITYHQTIIKARVTKTKTALRPGYNNILHRRGSACKTSNATCQVQFKTNWLVKIFCPPDPSGTLLNVKTLKKVWSQDSLKRLEQSCHKSPVGALFDTPTISDPDSYFGLRLRFFVDRWPTKVVSSRKSLTYSYFPFQIKISRWWWWQRKVTRACWCSLPARNYFKKSNCRQQSISCVIDTDILNFDRWWLDFFLKTCNACLTKDKR